MAEHEDVAAIHPERLADIGAKISLLFNSLKHNNHGQLRLESRGTTTLDHETERFELWAVNLGLYHFGHSSLDYRLREVGLLYDAFRALLVDLRQSLTQISNTNASGNILPVRIQSSYQSDTAAEKPVEGVITLEQQNLIDDYGSDDGHEQESDYVLLIKDVSDIIDRLYKIATKIRTSSSRLRSSKTSRYTKINDDTQVDLIEMFKEFDALHVRELFQHYRKSAALDNENFLQYRLSSANTRRRQQFGHWKQHHKKMAQLSAREMQNIAQVQIYGRSTLDPAKSLPQRSNPINSGPALVEPSITTATRPAATRIRLDDQSSAISISTYAGSEPGIDKAQDFPEPPKSYLGLKYFQCPYCYTLCSGNHLEKRAWRSHLIHDLRPYVCTYQYCAVPDVTYDRRQDWVDHESSAHRKVWRCWQHTDQAFANISAYESHLHEMHLDELANLHLDEMLRAGETSASTPERPCPFCLATFDHNTAMERHVAKHLERIALFALPRSTGLEENRDDEEDSSGQVEGSQSSCSSLSAFSNESSLNADISEPSRTSLRARNLSLEAVRQYQEAGQIPNQSKVHGFLANLELVPIVQAEEQRRREEKLELRPEAASVHEDVRNEYQSEAGRRGDKAKNAHIAEGEQDLVTENIFIAVMGLTGAGKSSFIKALTQSDGIALNHDIVSDVIEIQVYIFLHNNRRIHLVDMPGFDNSYYSDSDVLENISFWLLTKYRDGIKLSGLLYLHRISDPRFSNASTRSLTVFKRLCGKENLTSVVLVTTHWENVDEASGRAREKFLLNSREHWGDMLSFGSQIQRHDGSQASALGIVSNIINRNVKVVLAIQHEMHDGLTLMETAAGRFLRDDMLAERTKTEKDMLYQSAQGSISREEIDDLAQIAEQTSAEDQKEAGIANAKAEELAKQFNEKSRGNEDRQPFLGSLIREAERAEDIADVLSKFRRSLTDQREELVSVIAELNGLAAALRHVDELTKSKYSRNRILVQEDLDIVLESVEFTLEDIWTQIGTIGNGTNRLTTIDYRTIWEDIHRSTAQSGKISLAARFQLYRLFLDELGKIMRRRTVSQRQIEDLRIDTKHILAAKDRRQIAPNITSEDLSLTSINKRSYELELDPSSLTSPQDNSLPPWDASPLLSPTPHSPTTTFSATFSTTSRTSGSAIEMTEHHWVEALFRDLSVTPLELSEDDIAVCHGETMPDAIAWLDHDRMEQVLKIGFASGLQIYIFIRPSDRRARILCETPERSGHCWYSCIPFNRIYVRRSRSVVTLYTRMNNTNEMKKWTNLPFTTMERLVLFYDMCLALRANDTHKPVIPKPDFELAGETCPFAGQIRDDGYHHALRIYRDRYSKAIRLQASIYDGTLKNTPIWTAFITDSSLIRDWMRLEGRRKVCLRSLKQHVFSSRYQPPVNESGEHVLEFIHAGDASDFIDTIRELAATYRQTET